MTLLCSARAAHRNAGLREEPESMPEEETVDRPDVANWIAACEAAWRGARQPLQCVRIRPLYARSGGGASRETVEKLPPPFLGLADLVEGEQVQARHGRGGGGERGPRPLEQP